MNSTGAKKQAPDATDPEANLTIGDLSDRTGLSPATLRMWETRHGFPVPHRLESGHRRYGADDVAAIQAVLRHKDAGTRLELAITRAMADAEPTAPSIYAHLRAKHPHLGVHRLKKSTLLALSWAIEDEFCAKADRAEIYALFQRERYYRSARPRWTELARVSARATVFADFAAPDPNASPVQVALPADAPMRREWAVVCDAEDLPVVLTAWELPGQEDVPEMERLFESMWSVDGPAVHDAARVCAAVARQYADPAAPSGAAHLGPDTAARLSLPHTPDLGAVTGLFNRVVAYVDRIG